MTVKLPEKAGSAPTVQEWDDLVRIAENLGAQVVQRDAALRQMQAERDAAQSDAHKWAVLANDRANALNAARAEVARLQEAANKSAQKIELWVHDTDQFSPRTSAEDMVVQDGQLEDLARIAAALRQPAPATAQPDATMLSVNSLQTSSQAPAKGQE